MTAPTHRRHMLPAAIGRAAAVTAVAVIGGLATDTESEWYRDLERPDWQPPGALAPYGAWVACASAPTWTIAALN